MRAQALELFEPIPQGPVEIDGAIPTEAQIDLGKMLFFEPRLSAGGNLSCNSCHNLGTGGADLAPVSIGHEWQKGGRNSPTVLNAVFNTAQFWDGRAADLVEQAGGPMVNPVEMAASEEHVLAVLTSMDGYVDAFAAAFPDAETAVTFDNAARAIAAFEATLVTPDSPFDRWMKGDDAAMTDAEKAGFEVFLEAGCASCHNGVNLGGNSYQPFGLVERPEWTLLPEEDKGRYAVTRAEEDAYVFKTPTLRNIALTPPYFHSGAVWSLAEAVEVMGVAQLGNELSQDDAAKIAVFLGALTGDQPQVTYPLLPPSGPTTPRPQQ
ncbi:MAG: cytochrome-c peroxidase [Pikeienuella sp.]